MPGLTTLDIAPSGMAKGTYAIPSLGASGKIVGQVQSNGHFNLISIDEVPGLIGITCGEFTLSNGHLVTTQWGFAETGCDNPGWSQDLVQS